MRIAKDNKQLFVLSILKSPEEEYNANSLAKLIGISSMGALKIGKSLVKENILSSRIIGRASIYKININSYSKQYIRFILKREVEQAPPYVKMWARELEKVKSAEAIVLFGSVLKKEKEAGDIDALILVSNSKFSNVKKEIENINSLNNKKVHPVYQTKEDLVSNLKKKDKVVLNAIKGLFIFGEDVLLEVLE